MKLKQTRPFVVVIPDTYKTELIKQACANGFHYGVFFDTAGKAHTEQINPGAKYQYIFRTDEPYD